ncbi:MAG: N-formylglutamate amidohydrolase [Bdellovibrionales bacterium]
MKNKPQGPAFFVTIPHSGEQIPPEAQWLMGLSEVVLMRDVDRFVDRIYAPSLQELGVPVIVTPWHRYAADLNRFSKDVDPTTVKGSNETPGKYNRGLHWAITTLGEPLMKEPISVELHQQIVKKYFDPFHAQIQKQVQNYQKENYKNIYHIDAHSMPSQGTKEHRDPGEMRADFVVSDQKGKSCSAEFKDLVIAAYQNQGFSVAYNWPYLGGRITEHYGQPSKGHHTIQVEMNRRLYMDESSKQYMPALASALIPKVKKALEEIHSGLFSMRFH